MNECLGKLARNTKVNEVPNTAEYSSCKNGKKKVTATQPKETNRKKKKEARVEKVNVMRSRRKNTSRS